MRPDPDAPMPPRPGQWVRPAGLRPAAHDALVGELARRPAVLLGESHDSAADHLWQLHVIAALHGRRADMAVGLEMVPRSGQPVLDAWVAGGLATDRMLDELDWFRIWGFDPELYLPVFRFARQFRLPLRALNVARTLPGRVRREGWDAVPAAEREGIGRPAPPPPGYERYLEEALAGHGAGLPDGPPLMPPERLAGFVAAQLVWDRALAEGIVAARALPGSPLVAALIGRGHLEYGYGVPGQLRALGMEDAAILLTAAPGERIPAGIADAVFVTTEADPPAPAPPRLGARLSDAGPGVRLEELGASGLFVTAGLEAGDVILAAGGQPLPDRAALIGLVRRMPPGCTLPLFVRRDGTERDAVLTVPIAG